MSSILKFNLYAFIVRSHVWQRAATNNPRKKRMHAKYACWWDESDEKKHLPTAFVDLFAMCCRRRCCYKWNPICFGLKDGPCLHLLTFLILDIIRSNMSYKLWSAAMYSLYSCVCVCVCVRLNRKKCNREWGIQRNSVEWPWPQTAEEEAKGRLVRKERGFVTVSCLDLAAHFFRVTFHCHAAKIHG